MAEQLNFPDDWEEFEIAQAIAEMAAAVVGVPQLYMRPSLIQQNAIDLELGAIVPIAEKLAIQCAWRGRALAEAMGIPAPKPAEKEN